MRAYGHVCVFRMNQYIGTNNTQHTRACTGILITNLGTPDAPTVSALRRYFAEFLADPRIVEMPRWIWRILLYTVILPIRPHRVVHNYKAIWGKDGSPLLAISQRQTQALQKQLLSSSSDPIKVVLAMRYGKPSIAAGLEELRSANARRILILPLYPQYSATTTASTFDAVTDALKRWRWLPELRTINHYHDHPAYIRAVADSIRRDWQAQGEPQRLLFSFHGLPQRYVLAGDPYENECHMTAQRIAEQMQLPKERWGVAFQSRFGREQWLTPYTDHTLREWANTGVKYVHVICPGFSADCLETLDEIAMQNHKIFLETGGERYHYIPALNDQPDHIQALAELISQHCHGWSNVSPDQINNPK